MQYSTTSGAQGICPPGWHIPTYNEFGTLKVTVNYNGNSLKAVGQGPGYGAGTDSSGFSALLAGRRNDVGSFNSLGNFNHFWSSEYSTASVYALSLGFANYSINLYYYSKDYGLSVRCLKD